MRNTILLRAPWLVFPLALAAILPALGCASREPVAGVTTDAGNSSDDAGALSCGDCAADAAAASDGGAALPPEGRSDGDVTEFANACLDGVDQNADHMIDCEDVSCSAAPSCCVGAITDGCCTGSVEPVSLSFVGCDGTGCAQLDALVQFGSPGPVVVDEAVAPIADIAADSAAISPANVDPRASLVTLEASLAIPVTTTAIDAVAFGLTGSVAPTPRVTPTLAVVVSASRGDVTLQAFGEIVGAFPAPTDGLYHSYTLSIGPSGDARVSGPTGELLSAHLTLPSEVLHPIVFGRATNPGSTSTTLPARLASLTVTQRGCDAPTALSRDRAPVAIVDHTGSALLSGLTAPNLAPLGTGMVLAFAAPTMGGARLAIYVATRQADGAFHVESAAPVVQPVLTPAAGVALTDPALRDDGDHWTLFATRISGDTSELVVSVGGPDHSLVFGPASAIFVAELAGESLDSPAPIPGSVTSLVARHGAGASSELVILELSDATAGVASAYAADTSLCGADDTCRDGARPAQRILAARVGTFSFDADEVRAPSVAVVNHVYRLYYAGRRGARWSIGMLIAADLGYWRSGNGGQPVLGADGDGFDAVSVMEPAVVVESGSLALYYLGSNGVETALGVSRGSSFGL